MDNALIVSDPDVMKGKPVARGTWITVELILDKLAVGEMVEKILQAYPRLIRVGRPAALAHAADTMRREESTWWRRPVYETYCSRRRGRGGYC